MRVIIFLLFWASSLAFEAPASQVKPSAYPQRVVSLDFALAATLVEMGLPPVGIADKHGYERWAQEPALPDSVVDLGSMYEPNLELLESIQPDLILITPYQVHIKPFLEKIAPVVSMTTYQVAGDVIEKSVKNTRELGTILGREAQAEALITSTYQAMQDAKQVVEKYAFPSFLVMRVHDKQHVWVYGENSLFQSVMSRIGLQNAWTQKTNTWGFSSQGLPAVTRANQNKETFVVFLEPMPDEGVRSLNESPLWRLQPWMQEKRYITLPPVLQYGALPAARRLSHVFVEALQSKKEKM
ncbi:iron-siderophore ABC transporter substrate-binding protein [Algicola sagamiensis]|uniref:iron-siderophore ABC transporter substrate-binding protein n=1 Tax=Algicola sagamiensis TaxID=163869 RepID=UPI0003700F43|nr:iron-siderophore ABC transporter substrate-binding protein [Algicola sagamiensis]